METTLIKTEDFKVEEFKGYIDKAPQTLDSNKISASKALEYGEGLLQRIKSEGMSDALDSDCNRYLVKLKKTTAKMNEGRKPITQMFQQLTKLYTGLEAGINEKSFIYRTIQGYRDTYAAEKIKRQQEIEKEAKRKAAVQNEKTAVRATIEEGQASYVYSYIDSEKHRLYEIFHATTLENFTATENKIKNFPIDYPELHFKQYKPDVALIYITQTDVQLIVKEYSVNFTRLADEFKQALLESKNYLIDSLPSKKVELEAMAKADKEEKERIERERSGREKEEKERLAWEKAEREAGAKAKAEANKQTDTANTLFNMEAEIAQVGQPTAQVRTGYEIEVKNPVGYLQIVSFYFHKKGNKETVEALGKKSLDTMKKFCEDLAKKEGEKIDNPYIVYHEKVKTLAKA